MDKFDTLLGDVIDRVLGIRSTSTGYQYSEIVRALIAVYLCGGDCMEDFHLKVRSFRADCGSYSEDVVKMVMEHTEKSYIRAERYEALHEKVRRQ